MYKHTSLALLLLNIGGASSGTIMNKASVNIFMCFLPGCPHYSWVHAYRRANGFPQRWKHCLAHVILPVDIFYELPGVLPINRGPFNLDFNVCYIFTPNCLSYFPFSSFLMTTFPRFDLSTVIYESLSILFWGKPFYLPRKDQAKLGGPRKRSSISNAVVIKTLHFPKLHPELASLSMSFM